MRSQLDEILSFGEVGASFVPADCVDFSASSSDGTKIFQNSTGFLRQVAVEHTRAALAIDQYPLKNSAILDSGTTIHIFNEITRFLNFGRRHMEILCGLEIARWLFLDMEM